MSKLLRIVVFAALACAPAALLAQSVDLRVSSASGSPANITLGTGNVTYSVSIFNGSGSSGTSPVLTMTLPGSSTYVSASVTGGGSCGQAAGTVTCNWASIPASNTFTATVVVTPTAGGTLTLNASVSGTESDPTPTNNTGSASVNVNSQIDLRVSSASGSPSNITLGTGNITYFVSIFNAATSQGTNPVLTMTLPSASTYVSASVTGGGTCGQAAGVVTCNWTSISASNTFTATVVVTPTAGGTATISAGVSGDQPDPTPANDTGSASVNVNDQIDLRVSSVSGTPSNITLGTGNITYFVSIFNASTSQGTNPVLTMTLPSASTYVSASVTGGGTCGQSAGVVTCNWTSISASNTFTATVVVTPTAGGTATISGSVTGDQPDPTTGNNSGSGSVNVNDQIDLRVSSVSGTPSNITLGTGNVTFFASVFNAATSQGTNPVLTMPVPSNSTYVSATVTGGGTCGQSAGTITCNWTSISASNTFTATVIVTPTAGGTLTLSASVTGDQPDPTTGNNSGSGSVNVNDQIDLRVSSVSGTPANITLGTGNVTFFASVFNAATSQGTNPVLTMPVPANSTYVSATVTGGGTCGQSAGTITCNWTTISASNTFTATVIVTPTAGGTLTLSASVTGDQPDPTTGNNSGSGSVNVNDQIDLRVSSVSGTPANITLGTGNVTFFASVFNAATSQGTNPVLTMPVPANSTYVSATVTGGGTCGQSAGTITCNWTSISASNTFTATVIVTPTAGGTLTLSAGITGDQPDPTPANNSNSGSVNVNAQIDLNISSISGSPDPITFGGGNVSFFVSLFNGSTSQGTNPVLTATLPSNSSYVSASTTGGGTCGQSAGVVTCNWTSISASNTFTITIIVTPTIPGTLTLSASATGDQPDSNTSNNSKSKTTTVNPTSCTAVPSGGAAWYRAENNGVDSIGPNFATASGGASYAAGKAGQAFTFDGVNDSVNAPMTAGLQLTTGATVEFWMKGDPSNGLNSCCQGLVATDMWAVEIVGGGIHWGLSTDNAVTQPFPSSGVVAISTNQWHHVAGTYDGATIALYIDGALAASTAHTGTISANSGFLSIGSEDGRTSACPACVGTRYYKGLIDEVTIYNRALSATEVQSVFGAGTFGKCYVAATAPTITGFTPAAGNTGSSVVITGTDFTAVSGVKFNGTAATFAGNSSSQITATVPGTATTGNISVIAGGGTATSASAFTVFTAAHWINSSGGNWNTPSNWSTGTVPTAANNVIIDANGTYTVNLDVTPAFNTLTVGGGATGTQTLDLGVSHDLTFTNPATVTASGALTFASGRLLGTGPLTVNGTMNWSSDAEVQTTVAIAGGATLNISGTGTRYINGGTLNNSGTVNWSGGNNISVYNSGVINNLATGLFSVTNNQLIYQHCCAAGQAFNNAGTFRKSVATGTTTVQTNAFNNTGTVDIQSGTFNPTGGGTSSSVFNATSPGTFLFSNTVYTLAAGATLTGNGNFQVASSQLNVSAAGVTIGHLTLSGGNLNINSGASVSTTSTGIIDWSSDATLSGAGPLNVAVGGTLNFSGSGTRYIDGGTLNNSGTINWSGGNNLSIYNSGVINNLAGALFLATNDQIIYVHCCSSGQAFNNAGTFRKTTATNTTTVTSNGFNNSGTVDVQSGTLNLTSGGTSTSVFNAAAAGRLLFNGAAYTLAGAATLTGPGNFEINGGQLNVTGSAIAVAHLTMSGGVVNVTGAMNTTSTGVVDWSSDAVLSGAGSMNIASGATMNITGTGTRYIDGGTLNNSGTINWSGGNNLSVYNSGVIHNQSGGLFSLTNNQLMYQHCCAAGQPFDNAGTFRKSIATGTTTIQSNSFANSGTVDVQSGTVNFNSGGTSTSVINAAAAGHVLFNGAAYSLAGAATLTGSGNFEISGGTHNVTGSAIAVEHLTMSGGVLNVTGAINTSASGTVDWSSDSVLTGAGSMTIAGSATLNITGTGTRYIDGGTLNNAGTVNWSGGNNISVYNSGSINNQSGALFDVKNDQLIYAHCCAAPQAFNNAGTFRKSTATGTTTISSIPFTNSGTLQAKSGTISFTSLFSNSGSPAYDFGIGSATTFGRLTFANSASLSGALIAAPINGFVPQGGQQFTIVSFPSGAATFSPKTLTYGSSPVRSFADTYTATAVTLTASGPTVSAVLSPNQGPGSGGTAVTITGTGFVSGGSLGVTFGGIAATAVTVMNATTITCTTPPHASGVVDVVVTNGDGQPTTVTNGFTYDTSPIVSAMRPNSGSVAGAGGVIFEGTNLSTVTSVTFGGASGTIISTTATQLVVAAPAHAAGTVNVAITNPVGTHTITNGFTYVDNDDAARDFFVNSNPSARWSYGYETTRGSAFNLYGTRGNSAGFDSWSSGGLPTLGRNSTTGTLQQGTNFTPSMKLLFHPGSLGENSVFRWTAPSTSQYRVHGYFVGLDSNYPTTTDVAILHNNSTAATLFSSNINSYNLPANFDVTTTFSAGDTVEFTVGYGSNGYLGDGTGLDVTIDPAGPANADVAISGSAPATVANAANFTYTTVVTNNGPAAASNVTATITLPANVTLNGSPTSTQGSCSGTNPITCSIGALPNTSTATQTISLTATGTGTAVLSASASATESDTNGTNNATTSNVGIGGTSSLLVTTNADSGTGSLRQAILDANASLCTAPCTIGFNLPGGQLTIPPPTSLPAVTAGGVSIDATTQPGYSGTPLVTLDGSSNPNPSAGLQLSGGNDSVKGLSIISFQGSAVVIDTAGSDTISANYLGLRTNGSTAGQNAGEGILVTSANNTIGGSTAAARNVISGNFGSGIVIKGVSGNIVRGNYIGLNAAGTTNVANQTDGIQLLNGASNNTIGGTAAADRNVISGNNNSGIYITSSATSCASNVIAGNLIGTDATGAASLGNTTGIYLGTNVSSNTFGGLTAGAGNTIVSNTTGINFDGPGSGNAFLRNSIAGNSGSTIDLAGDGPTANDAGDGDLGPNNLQNTPTFVDASLAGGTLTVHVSVDSPSAANVAGIRVELFKSDASGVHPLAFIASQCFAGNALNGAAIIVSSAPVVTGDKLVATATSYADGACGTVADGTSELSPAVTITTCTPPSATITAGGPTTFCTGGSVTLTASAGASYQWRNFATPIVGANAQQYVATTAGSYTVTVTNAGGCSATSSPTSVSVNSTVSVTISAGGPTTFCAGGSVTLTANPSGGSGTFAAYQWLLNGSPIGGANASTYNATAAGNYTVTVTDSAGCTGTSAPQSVTVNAPPSAAINAPASTCANSNAGASVVSPVGGATYTWSITNGTISSGQGTFSIIFTAGTSSPVSLSVTASLNGCTATGNASVAVGSFTPTITGSNTFCPGGNTTLTSSAGSSYQWSLNGSTIGGATSQTYVANVAGNYTVAVTNGSGCSGTSAPFAVAQAPLPAPTVTASGPTTFCSGGSVTLTASAASTYQWLLNGVPINGSTSQSFNATATGSYSVTVTSGSCSATSSPIAVTVNPTPSVAISGPAAVCAGGNATLDAGAGFATYAWSTGATTQSITVSPASTTTYSVTVTNNGCSATASKTVTLSSGATSAAIQAPSSVPSNSSGNTASVPPAQSGSTYNWTISGGTITSGNGTPSIVWSSGNSGTATINVTITSGSCTASGSANVAINDSADLALTLSAAPNPVNPGGTVTFTLNAANNGPSTAQNVTVINSLFGVTAAAASGNGWSCSVNGLSVVCTRPSFAPGPAAAITIIATATNGSSAGDDAAIGSATADPNVNNNSAGGSVAVGTAVSCNNNAPSLLSPAAGASNLASSVNFSWSATANATSYDLWIASSGGAPAIATTTQSTSATINLPSGPSTWYVAAHFPNDCPTLASPPRALTVAASTNCTQAAPQLIAPSPNANVNSPVTFSWTAVPQAVGYRLWIAIDGGAIQDAATTNGVTSATIALSGTNVLWHVDAIFPGCAPASSASSAFTLAAATGCASHAAPSLLAPAPNATLPSSITDLQWTSASGANGYRVWASINGGDFAPIATTPPVITTLHFTFTTGTVAWYVEALFDGCASMASAPQPFTIPPAQSCNNGAATPLAPANDVNLTTGFVQFDWSTVPNAIGYELWFSIDGGAPSLAATTTGTFLRRTVGTGNIEWFVRALFDRCDAVDSPYARFTFTPPADCSVARSILTAPFDGAPVFAPFDLRWSNVPGASQYKVWLAAGAEAPKVIGTTALLHLDGVTAPAGPVTWSVEALFDHCPPVRSTVSTFNALPPPPACATPGVPLPRAESTASTNVEYLIRWTPVGPKATTQYELQESSDAAFTAPASVTTDASEQAFIHINSGDAPVTYYYRVRAVATCNGARSLFSLPLAVQVLPSNVVDPSIANGSTPADNPQTTHYQIHLGGGTGSASNKGAIAAAAGDSFTATTNQPWLTVSPSSGTVAPEGTTLNVTAKTDGLPVGTSSGAVNVTFGSPASASHGRITPLGDKPPATTTVSVNLVQPVSPTSKNGPPPDALIIPAVAHADGINSKFQSDVRVTNSSAQPMKYQVTFTPTGDAGISQGKQTTVDIDPGRTIALDDVLQSWFGSNGATGTLEVRPLTAAATSSSAAQSTGLANLLTFASSRTFNATSNGTFGQYVPAIPFAAFVGRASDPTKSTVLSLQQIAQSPAYRTNLGIVEGSGDPASVLVSVFGDDGKKLTEFTQELKGGQHIQLNSVLAQKNVQVNDGRIEVKVVSPAGKITAYASVLDNLTNDPLLVTPVAVNAAAAPRYVIPGVADLNNGFANWQTDVRLFNPSANIVKATLTFFSQNGGTPQSKEVSLAPNQVQTFDAALHQFFGLSNDSGALHITSNATTPLVATSRTYNQTANGTYGQFVSAVTANDAAALGTRPLQLLQIEESDRYRTNVGFAEVTGKGAKIEVTAIPSDSKVAASTQIDIAPNQFIQYPQMLKSMGLSNMYNARVSVKVISGQGRITAFASVIDSKTNDPTFVPAQ